MVPCLSDNVVSFSKVRPAGSLIEGNNERLTETGGLRRFVRSPTVTACIS